MLYLLKDFAMSSSTPANPPPYMQPPNVDPLRQLKGDMQINKVTFKGKEIALIGHAIELCEKLINSVKRTWQDAKVHYNYGVNRKEVKKQINDLLKSYKKMEITFDKINRELSKSPTDEKDKCANALKTIHLDTELDKQISDFKQKYNNITTALPSLKNQPFPEEYRQNIQENIEREQEVIASACQQVTAEEDQAKLRQLANQYNLSKLVAFAEPPPLTDISADITADSPINIPMDITVDKPIDIPADIIAVNAENVPQALSSSSSSFEDDIAGTSEEAPPTLPFSDHTEPEQSNTATAAVEQPEDAPEALSSSSSSFEDDSASHLEEAPAALLPPNHPVNHPEGPLSAPEQPTAATAAVAQPVEHAQAKSTRPAKPKAPIVKKTEFERDEIFFQNALDGIEQATSRGKSTRGLVRQLLKLLDAHPSFATDPLPDGRWALHVAVHHGQQELIDKLLDLGAGTPAFDAAIDAEDNALVPKIFEAILKHTDAFSKPDFATTPMKDGRWALHIAVKYGPPELVEKLLNLGAGPPAFDAAARRESDPLLSKVFLAEDQELIPKLFEAILRHENSRLIQTNPQGTVEAAIDKARQASLPPYSQKYAEYTDRLAAAVHEGDLEACVQMMLDGADLSFRDKEDGGTLLHVAATQNHKLIAQALLSYGLNPKVRDKRLDPEERKKQLDPKVSNKQGKTFWNLAEEKGWSEYLSADPAAIEQQQKNIDAFRSIESKHLLLKGAKAREKTLFQQGFIGHNPLLTEAITRGDVKGFIHLAMDGAALDTRDKDGNSLLDLAASHNNKQLAAFLLSKNVKPASQEKFAQLAQANGWKELIQEDAQSAEQRKQIDDILDGIAQKYEQDRLGYSDQFREHLKHKAMHGSSGHNKYLKGCLERSDWNGFIEAAEMGASIDTVDDKGYSLLHHAVEANAIEIMDYLLLKYREKDNETQDLVHPNLSPLQFSGPIKSAPPLKTALTKGNFKEALKHALQEPPQTFRETPLSMAIRKKNFSAACLLLTQGDTRQTFSFNMERNTMNAALQAMKRISQVSDSLHITVEEKSRLFSAGCWLLLSQACLAGGFTGLSALFMSMQVASAAEKCFQELYFQQATLEHKVNPQTPAAIPGLIKHTQVPLSKWAFAEVLTGAAPVATVFSRGIDAYMTVSSIKPALENAYKGRDRPQKAGMKAAVNLVTAGRSVYNFVNILAAAAQPVAAFLSYEAPLAFPEEPLETLTEFPTEEQLQASPEYAEQVLKYFAARERVNHGAVSELHIKAGHSEEILLDTAKKIEKAFRQSALVVHPDKGGSQSLATLVHNAKKVLLDRHATAPEATEASWQIPGYVSSLGRTAFSVGLAWTLNQAAIHTNTQFQTIAMSAMALYGVGSWTYNTFWTPGGEPSPAPDAPPPQAEQGPLSLG